MKSELVEGTNSTNSTNSGEIDRHRLTDIICILTISKIKLVEVVLPNVHLRYND